MKAYLGDAVYVDFVHCQLVLTVEYGDGPVNTIILDGDVYNNLLRYVKDLKNQQEVKDNAKSTQQT